MFGKLFADPNRDKLVARALIAIRSRIDALIAVAREPSKRPKEAAEMGIAVNDPATTAKQLADLRILQQRWDPNSPVKWYRDPQLMAELNAKVAELEAQPPPPVKGRGKKKPPPAAPGELKETPPTGEPTSITENELTEGLHRDPKNKKNPFSNHTQLQERSRYWIDQFNLNPTFPNLWRAWFYAKLRGGKAVQTTLLQYVTQANQLLQAVPGLQTADLRTITSEDVAALTRAMYDNLKKSGRGSTYTKRMLQLKLALKWAQGKQQARLVGDVSGPDVVEGTKKLGQGKRQLQIQTGRMVEAIADKLRTILGPWAHDAADFVELLAYTGLRPNEVSQIHWSDVDFERGIIRIWEPLKDAQVAKGPIDYVMNPALRNALLRIQRENPNDNFGSHEWFQAANPKESRDANPGDVVSKVTLRSEDWLQQFNAQYLKPASTKLGFKKPVTAYEFRHFFQSYAKSLGVSQQFVDQMLGRQPQNTAEGYIHWLGNSQKEAAKLIFGTRADTQSEPVGPVGRVRAPQIRKADLAAMTPEQKKEYKRKQGALREQERRNRLKAQRQQPPPPPEPGSLPESGATGPRRRRVVAPQFELPGMEGAFNLAGETAAAPEPAAPAAAEVEPATQGELPGTEQPKPTPTPQVPPSTAPALGSGLAPGEGLTREEVQALVRDQDRAGFPVRVVTPAELATLTGVPMDRAVGYAGFAKNGVIYIVPQNISRAGAAKEVRRVIRHEAAHIILRTREGMAAIGNAITEALNLTEAEVDAILKPRNEGGLGYGLTEEQRAAFRSSGKDEAWINQYERILAYDEFFAAARGRNQNLWQKILEAVKRFLAQHGLAELTNEETARALLRAVESQLAEARSQERALVASGALPEIGFATPQADEPQGEGGGTTHNIAGVTYNVPGKDSFTKQQLDEAAARVAAFFKSINLPGQADATPRGNARGNVNSNAIYTIIDDGKLRDVEVNGKLIPEVTRAFQKMQETRPDAAYALQLINAISKNFVYGNWNDVVTPDTLNKLMPIVRDQASWIGQMLNVLEGVGNNAEEMARNAQFYIRRIWGDHFAGAEVTGLISRVLNNFRDWFTEKELNEFAETLEGQNRLKARDKLQGMVTRLTGLNRQDQGGHIYRFIQRLFKPKFAKSLARLEADDRVQKAAFQIIEDLRKQDVLPKPSVGQAQLTPIQSLIKSVEEGEPEKIDAAIRIAVREGELNAGKKYALSQIEDEEERIEREKAFTLGEEPKQFEIDAGLENPEFSHWKILKDSFLGYEPITLKHAEDIINEHFKGVQRKDIYGGTREEKPPDFRIDLNALAKTPKAYYEAEFKRVMDKISAVMQLSEVDDETFTRITHLITDEFNEQIQLAKQRFLSSFLNPPLRKAAPTPQARFQQLLNANLAKEQPLMFVAAKKILDRVTQRFANAADIESIAGNGTTEEKARWVESTKDELIAEFPDVANLPADDPFRMFAEQAVMNDLSGRIQAKEAAIVAGILNSPDVVVPEVVTPEAYARMTPDEQKAADAKYFEQQKKVAARLQQNADQLRKAVNAGLIVDPEDLRSALNKSVVQKNLPTLNQMIRQALNFPITEHGDIAANFADAMVNDLRVDPRYRNQLMELIEEAYGAKFREARKRALAKAVEGITPAESRELKKPRATWELIERLVNVGAMDDGTILEALAVKEGWKPLTPELRDKFKKFVTRMDELRDLTKEERKKKIAEWKRLTPEQQAAIGSVDTFLDRAAQDKFAITTGERIRLKKEIETHWARLLKPIDLRTRNGRQNAASAAMELSAANLLFRVSFPFRQLFDIITQGAVHTPTRALATVLEKYQEERGRGLGGKPETNFWKDFTRTMHDAYRTRFAHWRETLSSAALSLSGTQDARNVDRLLTGIAAFERADQYADELAAQGKTLQSRALKLMTLMRMGFRVAQAFDQIHGVPAEYQEMRQEATRWLLENGTPRSVVSARVDDLIGDARGEWGLALTAAKAGLEDAGLTPTPTEIRGAAANLVKARAYQRMAEVGMPADDFENRGNELRNVIGWNQREAGGLGGIVASTFQKLRQLSQHAPLPLSVVGSIFNFGNAIGTSINRTLSFTPLGFYPRLFGVEAGALREGRQTIAQHGSPWFRTPTDRVQRKIEATIGTSIGSLMFTLAAMGILKVRLRWPEDKEERELWQAQGHQPGTVEFVSDDGKTFLPISMNTGPFALVRPYLAAGGALNEALEKREKAQVKLNEEAARRGLAPGKVPPLSVADMIGVAAQAAQGAIAGGRTASGLIGAFSDYGTPNVKKATAGVVAPYVPGLPALQEVSRMAGVRLDAKTASVMDFLVPLPTSQAAAVNMLGDKVGTRDDAQRVIQILTGGTYPAPVSTNGVESLPAYKALFTTGYRPPSISSTQGYVIGGEFRPFTGKELATYSRVRGEEFKKELLALPADATKEQARAAFQTANDRALTTMGAQKPVRLSSARASSGGSAASVLGAGGALGLGSASIGGGSRLGGSARGSGRLRRSFGGTRTVRLPRPRLPKIRTARLRSLTRRRRRTRQRRTRIRSYA